MTDTLLPEPHPDRFEHESPIRAFTEWNVSGTYAIGKGFRPSVAHLPTYLDAMERKEGWRLVQILYADDHERRSLVFRSRTVPQFFVDTPPEDVVERLRESIVNPDKELTAINAKEKAGMISAAVAAEQRSRIRQRQTREYTGSTWTTPEDNPALYREECPVNPEELAHIKDDPVNPKHYGGTACAEIGELLTPNAYQTLKYCWRLGEKDDPVIELGKAIWYWKREMELRKGIYSYKIEQVKDLGHRFLENRIKDRTPFTQNVAGLMWTGYAYGMDRHGHRTVLAALQKEQDRRRKDR